jgi:hypothetical protein
VTPLHAPDIASFVAEGRRRTWSKLEQNSDKSAPPLRTFAAAEHLESRKGASMSDDRHGTRPRFSPQLARQNGRKIPSPMNTD